MRARKGIISFLKEMGWKPGQYFEDSVVAQVGADIDALDDGPFDQHIQEPEDARAAIKRHGLNEALKTTVATLHC